MKTNEQLLDDIAAMAPWHHTVRINDDVTTNVKTVKDATGQTVHKLDPHNSFRGATKDIFPNGLEGRSFLDCACNCGGYSFAAKDAGASETYSFDVREHWINQAKFVQENRKADSTNMTFEVADLLSLGSHKKKYDVTWFSGIFYHLPDPVTGLQLAADITNEVLFLNTACAPWNEDEPEVPALMYKQEGVEQLMSGVYGLSWMPSGPQVLKEILHHMGFKETKVYFWVSRQGTSERTGGGRVAIVASRKQGQLDKVKDLKRPVIRP